MKFSQRKYRCTNGECNAELPEVFSDRIQIKRGEIDHFILLIESLGDALLSYHIIPPGKQSNYEPEKDNAIVIIWVDPRKHHEPEFLVNAAANIAWEILTLEEELDYMETHDEELFLTQCRELNCPVCKKNHLHTWGRAMTYDDYCTKIAAAAGIGK